MIALPPDERHRHQNGQPMRKPPASAGWYDPHDDAAKVRNRLVGIIGSAAFSITLYAAFVLLIAKGCGSSD